MYWHRLDRLLLKVNIGTTGEDRDINILRSREKGSGTGTLNTCSPEKALCHRRTVTGVPSLNTVQGLWRLLDGKTWSQQDKIFNGSKEDKLS
jgi:hypothetical protein